MLGAPLAPAYATGSVTGVATGCSGIASCKYSLTDGSGGTGSASTSAFVGGYVGQSPLPFSGGSVTFQLPGEAQATYASGTYSGMAVLDGTSSTAGTLYQTNGTFWATDVNTGLVVTGTTSTIVGISGHSGRGGGNVYTLVSGTISITPITSPLSTATSVSCNPTSTAVNAPTACTATVTNTDGTAVPPSGSITFGSGGGAGAFSSGSCSLAGTGATSTCEVSYTPSPGSEGQQTITADYAGDSNHLASSASFLLGVDARGVSVSLTCASSFRLGRPVACTAWAADASPGTPMNPTGTVTFSIGRAGRFSSTSCSLTENNDVSTCSVTFTPMRIGLYTLSATYGGDPDHSGGTASGTFRVFR